MKPLLSIAYMVSTIAYFFALLAFFISIGALLVDPNDGLMILYTLLFGSLSAILYLVDILLDNLLED